MRFFIIVLILSLLTVSYVYNFFGWVMLGLVAFLIWSLIYAPWGKDIYSFIETFAIYPLEQILDTRPSTSKKAKWFSVQDLIDYLNGITPPIRSAEHAKQEFEYFKGIHSIPFISPEYVGHFVSTKNPSDLSKKTYDIIFEGKVSGQKSKIGRNKKTKVWIEIPTQLPA